MIGCMYSPLSREAVAAHSLTFRELPDVYVMEIGGERGTRV